MRLPNLGTEAISASAFESAAWSRAVTLKERIGWQGPDRDHCSPVIDIELATRRIERWRSEASLAGASLARRLAADGITEDDLFYCLGEPAEALDNRLPHSPAWLLHLASAFSCPIPTVPLPLPNNLRRLETTGFLNLIEPLLRDALNQVRHAATTMANSIKGSAV
jgi:hypothetical protein